MMTIRSAARLAGLALMLIWASLCMDYAVRWISPASYYGAAAAEPLSSDDGNGDLTSSTMVIYAHSTPSLFSTLPLLAGSLLLIWCPRPLARFLEAGNS